MHKTELSEETVAQLEPVTVLGEQEDFTGANALLSPVFTPRVFPLSGLYRWQVADIKWELVDEQLRLDVDGNYPQMVASGTIRYHTVSARGIHWIANLTPISSRHWSGTIWFTDSLGTPGSYPFPYTTVDIVVTGGGIIGLTPPSATLTFSGGGASRVRVLKLVSPWFREVEFEFDSVDGVTAVTAIQTHAHPNHPPTLPNQTLSIQTVFSRAGFDVQKSGKDNIVPLAAAGKDAQWSDSEMHDAMQTYWSRFTNDAQWSLWLLFAWQHVADPSREITPDSLGGIMFDDIGPNHRQGAAVFNGSLLRQAPSGDAAPIAWVQRMRFFAAIHEMGHTFNLAHSWQKSLGRAWWPLDIARQERSIMNYPQNVMGGQTSFFADFEYRFSDPELLFMRHAPERFVQMGNAAWFDHHGFEQADVSPEPRFNLEVRVNRRTPLFEFMEPVVLEFKLTNVSGRPQVISDHLLTDLGEMTVIVKHHRREARQLLPYVQHCFLPGERVLMPNTSTYASLFVSAGQGGWLIDEPGYYTIQLALHLEGEDVLSNPLRVRVAPPRSYDEEFLAQELFTDDVGRILALGGSQYLKAGNDTLREITERLGDRRVALHAHVALATPLMREYKQLVLPAERHAYLRPAAEVGGKIKLARPRMDEAREELYLALIKQGEIAAVTLGHIAMKHHVDRFSRWLAEQGDTKEAAAAQDSLHQTLTTCNVLPQVLAEVKAHRDSYKTNGRRPARTAP